MVYIKKKDRKPQTHIPITKEEKRLALKCNDEDEFYGKYKELYPDTGRNISAILSIFKNRRRYKNVILENEKSQTFNATGPGENEPDQLTLMIDMKNQLAEVIDNQNSIIRFNQELIRLNAETLTLQQEKFEYVKSLSKKPEE